MIAILISAWCVLMSFENKVYDVIIPAHDIKKLLSDSKYFVDLFMWPKFGHCSLFKREVIVTSEKLSGGHGLSLIIWGWY